MRAFGVVVRNLHHTIGGLHHDKAATNGVVNLLQHGARIGECCQLEAIDVVREQGSWGEDDVGGPVKGNLTNSSYRDLSVRLSFIHEVVDYLGRNGIGAIPRQAHQHRAICPVSAPGCT